MTNLLVPPPGELVDTGGRRMHVRMMGEGSPLVILEAGMLSMSLQWARVAPAVARFTRVLVYDRAGYGWSDPGPAPRTSGQAVRELHTLLGAMGVAGPLVLAGHSYGGLVARHYAARFPADVAGLVLFDPTHPDQFARLDVNVAAQSRVVRVTPLLARAGALWLASLVPHFPLLGILQELPDRDRALARRLLWAPGHFQTARAEWEAQPESFRQVKAIPLSRHLHLTVVSSGKAAATSLWGLVPAEMHKGLGQLNAELAARVPGARHVVEPGLDHQHLAGVSKESAPVAVRWIREAVAAVRGEAAGVLH